MFKIIYSSSLVLGVMWSLVGYSQGSPTDLPSSVYSNEQVVSPTSAKNYICTFTYREALVSHPSTMVAGQASVDVAYFDGLGRPSQTVAVMGSPAGKDIVNWQTYDAYGRVSTQYVPYTKSTTGNNGAYTVPATLVTEQNTFLTGIYGSTDGSKGYGVTVYENSPLDRVMLQGAPGDTWQPTAHPVAMAYETNASAVATWSYTGDTYSAYSFPVNSLYVYKTTDEDGNQARDYKDKEGRLIMREAYSGSTWLKTRYCYDEFSLLRCVVPPAGSIENTNYCYYYKYDQKKRLIAKQLPGCSWNYMVYDTRDRLVLTQDGALGTTNWNYTLYDQLNRPVETGTYTTSATQDALTASFVSNIDYLSTQTKTPCVYIYYDSYTALPAGYTADITNGVVASTDLATSNIGRQTWSKTKLLETETGMNTWLNSVIYYDKYGQVIQTVSDNHLGGKDYLSNKYSFSGQIIYTLTKHIVDGEATSVDKSINYDHRGRLLKINYHYQSGYWTLLAAYVYDEAGNQKIKYQDSQNNSTFLQKIDYTYNIRGWLTQINDPSSFAENDKFGLKLYYGVPPTGGKACFNGNISGMGWGSALKPNLVYRFAYDGVNRLTASDYVGTAYPAGAFATSYSYDNNGNIKSITRKNASAALIDDLNISNLGNRIDNITWDIAGDYGGSSYVDYPGLSSTNSLHFSYDNNGNMTYEPYKMMSLTYNRLNLPEVINFGSNKKISYFYTASGQKVRQTVENTGSLTKVDYCGPFVYETVNGVRSLKYLITEEGRVVKSGTSWIWEYNQRDHLGDVCTVVRRNSTTGLADLVQDNHYFPFGMLMSDISTSSADNRFRYNGKEYQHDLNLEWYDYGARFYDPALARWHSMDPLAEKYYGISPYMYCAGNPVRYIDLNGEDVYLFYWVKSDNEKDNAMFFQSALTRAKDAFQNMKEGDAYRVSAIEDLGTLGSKVSNDVKELSPKYGETREFGLWSHSGILDGPRGSATTSGLDGVSRNQMSVEGWGKINFNWASGDVKAGFYGCNTGSDPDGNGPKASFTTKLSAQSNFKDVNVWGQTSSSYPSQYTNVRENTVGMIDGKFIYPTYMVGAEGLNVTGRFVPTSSPANPMRVSVNGKGSVNDSFGRLIYQPGNKR